MIVMTHAPANSAEIQSIIGPSDENLIGEILCVGATAKEIAEAYAQFNGYETARPSVSQLRPDIVLRLYEILNENRDGHDER